MKKYRVSVHCQNLVTNIHGVQERMAFHTHVWVEAFTPADAEARAIELVREDTHLLEAVLNDAGDPLSLSADEVREVGTCAGNRLRGRGLALYREGT